MTNFEEHEQITYTKWNWKRILGSEFTENADGSLTYSLSVTGAIGDVAASRTIPDGKWRKRETKHFMFGSVDNRIDQIKVRQKTKGSLPEKRD